MMRSWAFPFITFLVVSMTVQAAGEDPSGVSIRPQRIAPPLFRTGNRNFSQHVYVSSSRTSTVQQISLGSDVPWMTVKPAEEISPSSSTSVYRVDVDVSNICSGRHTGTVQLTSAEWLQPMSVPVTISIQAPITPSPSVIHIYDTGKLKQPFLALYSEKGLSYNVTRIKSPRFLSVSPGSVTDGPHRYMLELDADFMPYPIADESIVFYTDHPGCPQITVPISTLSTADLEEQYRARRENRPIRSAE